MPTWVVVLIVIAAVVVAGAVVWLVMQEMQRKRLQRKFGPEYERAVADHDNPRAAQRELAAREKRHNELDIRPLSPQAKERYTAQWAQIQAQFVDSPSPAVAEADRVLTQLMAERGYPTEGYDQQLADLSVKHSKTLDHYRHAHETMVGHEHEQKSTEDLRDAMVRYRTVFEDLLDDDAADDGHRHGETKQEAKHDAKHDPKHDDRGETRTEARVEDRIDERHDTTNERHDVRNGR
ncbi:hypothetical protein [Amycolatopsis magusensis]|uniref:Secreted protein n=1 Tax=Amycolatopsis magusensis TaxID=882444 RepID=A0ABS4PZH6_9PSEU|nr:hypothetical protein [Amycolatopsis magusensis]MBP2184822.1 hypothetical protein [Amycolatopsis magusensis]